MSHAHTHTHTQGLRDVNNACVLLFLLSLLSCDMQSEKEATVLSDKRRKKKRELLFFLVCCVYMYILYAQHALSLSLSLSLCLLVAHLNHFIIIMITLIILRIWKNREKKVN